MGGATVQTPEASPAAEGVLRPDNLATGHSDFVIIT